MYTVDTVIVPVDIPLLSELTGMQVDEHTYDMLSSLNERLEGYVYFRDNVSDELLSNRHTYQFKHNISPHTMTFRWMSKQKDTSTLCCGVPLTYQTNNHKLPVKAKSIRTIDRLSNHIFVRELSEEEQENMRNTTEFDRFIIKLLKKD